MQKKCVDKGFYAQIFLLFALFLCQISTYSLTIIEWSKFIFFDCFPGLNIPATLGRSNRYQRSVSSHSLCSHFHLIVVGSLLTVTRLL